MGTCCVLKVANYGFGAVTYKRSLNGSTLTAPVIPNDSKCETVYDRSGPILNPVIIYPNLINAAYQLAAIDQMKIWSTTEGFTLPDYDIDIVFGPTPDAPDSESNVLQTHFVIWGLLRLASALYQDNVWKPAGEALYWKDTSVGLVTIQAKGVAAEYQFADGGLKRLTLPLVNVTTLVPANESAVEANTGIAVKCSFIPQARPIPSIGVFILALHILASMTAEGLEKLIPVWDVWIGWQGGRIDFDVKAISYLQGGPALLTGLIREVIIHMTWFMIGKRHFRPVVAEAVLGDVTIARATIQGELTNELYTTS